MASTWLNHRLYPHDRTTHYRYRTTILHTLEQAINRTPVSVCTHYFCGGFTTYDPEDPEPRCDGVATCITCAARWSGRG